MNKKMKSRRRRQTKKRNKNTTFCWFGLTERKESTSWARPLRILIWGRPNDVIRSQTLTCLFLFWPGWPPAQCVCVPPLFLSPPPPSVAFVQFHLSTLAGCPDIQLDLYFLEHTSDFIISDCKHGTDVIESMLKRTIDLFVPSIFLWPPWRRTP